MPSAAINKRGAFLNWRFAVKGIQYDSRSDAAVFGIDSSFAHRNETSRGGKRPGNRYKLQLSRSVQERRAANAGNFSNSWILLLILSCGALLFILVFASRYRRNMIL